MAEFSNLLDKAALAGGINFAEPGADVVPGIPVCSGEVTGDEIGSDVVLACRVTSIALPDSGVGTDIRVSTGEVVVDAGVVISFAGFICVAEVCTVTGTAGADGTTPEAGTPLVIPWEVVTGPRGAGLVYTKEEISTKGKSDHAH